MKDEETSTLFHMPHSFLFLKIEISLTCNTVSLRCMTPWFDIFIYCNMMNIVVLAFTFTISHNHHFFFIENNSDLVS